MSSARPPTDRRSCAAGCLISASASPPARILRKSDRCTATRLIEPSSSTSTARQASPDSGASRNPAGQHRQPAARFRSARYGQSPDMRAPGMTANCSPSYLSEVGDIGRDGEAAKRRNSRPLRRLIHRCPNAARPRPSGSSPDRRPDPPPAPGHRNDAAKDFARPARIAASSARVGSCIGLIQTRVDVGAAAACSMRLHGRNRRQKIDVRNTRRVGSVIAED